MNNRNTACRLGSRLRGNDEANGVAMMESAYGECLATIHDDGFVDLAESAASVVLRSLAEAGLHHGEVADLGCGSGRLAEILSSSGYHVLGIDLSPAMIALARKRAPKAVFRVGSFLQAELPESIAVTAIGECFNYMFDDANHDDAFSNILRRVYDCLQPGGLFLFDIAVAGRLGGRARQKTFVKHADWVVLVDAEEKQDLLTRRITCFRRTNDQFIRDDEIHILRLLDQQQVFHQLQSIGFVVKSLDTYGKHSLPTGLVAFHARKS